MVPLFSEVCKAFLTWAESTLHKKTRSIYSNYFRKFEQALGDRPADEYRPADLQAWGKTWHAVQAIQRVYRWAHVDAQLLAKNQMARVKRPALKLRRRIMSPVELTRMLRRCRHDLRDLLIGYRETAARPGELRLATIENLYVENPSEDLFDALAAGRVCLVWFEWKSWQRRADVQRPRTIVLSPRACRLILRRLQRKRHKSDYLFTTERGKPWTPNALRCRFRRLRKRLSVVIDSRGETIVPYTFRHTAATIAAARGVLDRRLADVLGHVETKTTARYCHLNVAHLREAMRVVWESKKLA